MTTYTTPEAIQELDACGWHAVADDLRDGISAEIVLSRLRSIGEEESEAAEIVSLIDES